MNPRIPELGFSEDTAENRLTHTAFLVEADSFAVHALWGDHAANSLYPSFNPRTQTRVYEPVTWEQLDGWLITVGTIGKHPVCISITWNRINGHLVAIWYSCIQVTDCVQAEDWLAKHFTAKYDEGSRRAWCDAMNFGHCLSALKERTKAVAREEATAP